MTCDFSLEHYREILETALNEGYQFSTMANAITHYNTFDKIICLRHDADYFNDVSNSLNFSAIEDEMGIAATYFFRVHGAYNLFTLENYKILKKLWRHEIGLHYEYDFAKLVGDNPLDLLQREISMLKSITTRPIEGVAYHCPTRCGYPLSTEVMNRIGVLYEAYDDFFTQDMKYISDSSGWREGCLCKWVGKKDKIVALMHQIHWYNDSPVETF